MTVFICEGQSQTTSVGINLRKILTHFSITYQVQSLLLWLIWERQWCRQKWYHTWADRPLILPLASIIKSYVTYGVSSAVLAAARWAFLLMTSWILLVVKNSYFFIRPKELNFTITCDMMNYVSISGSGVSWGFLNSRLISCFETLH